MEIVNLGAADELPPVNWSEIAEKLEMAAAPRPDAHNARTTWLVTSNVDGSSHVTPVGAVWMDGTFWFQTGAGTKKSRNLARDPRCSIAVSILDADVVLEGDAARVTNSEELTRIAAVWANQGWPAQVNASGDGITAPYNAPLQGPPPWSVYRITAKSVVVTLGVEPGGLTRFNF